MPRSLKKAGSPFLIDKLRSPCRRDFNEGARTASIVAVRTWPPFAVHGQPYLHQLTYRPGRGAHDWGTTYRCTHPTRLSPAFGRDGPCQGEEWTARNPAKRSPQLAARSAHVGRPKRDGTSVTILRRVKPERHERGFWYDAWRLKPLATAGCGGLGLERHLGARS